MPGSPSLDGPEPDPEPLGSPATQKRKASPSPTPEDDNDTSKRQRRDSTGNSDRHDSYRSPPRRRQSLSPSPEPERRRSVTQEEKKRGMRLFGGLLNTLSQTGPTTQQKKRQEVERRQQERARRQRAEEDRRHEERLGRLAEVRRAEQITFDERVMKARHERLRATATCLRTRAGPRIYYRPFELTRDQEDKIKDQVRDVDARIAREVDDFDIRKQEHQKKYGRGSRPSTARGEPSTAANTATAATTTAAATDASASVPPSRDTNDSAMTDTPRPRSGSDKIHHDEGDEVVVADEDMVIY